MIGCPILRALCEGWECKPFIDPTIPLHYPNPMKVSAQYAETHLSQLISAADNGEEVEIDRPGKPALHLVVDRSAAVQPPPKKRLLGAGKGEIWLADDWDSPKTNKEIENLFENSPIFPESPTV
jgi:antitoxin (DNA-binding transcriptional repressor) of toxin-antitoxin stability system